MSQPAVLTVTGPDEMAEALAVRRRVFIEEQGVPEELEIDAYDAPPFLGSTALHVLVRLDGVAVATGRLLIDGEDGHAHVGRVAVLARVRGRGYGRAVMAALHEIARERGVRHLTLAAQLHAVGFYERLCYAVRDDVFLDAGIEHRWMDLQL
jgi:predicted GNAT family N-acyltransferase